jgi:hypothetical protein
MLSKSATYVRYLYVVVSKKYGYRHTGERTYTTTHAFSDLSLLGKMRDPAVSTTSSARKKINVELLVLGWYTATGWDNRNGKEICVKCFPGLETWSEGSDQCGLIGIASNVIELWAKAERGAANRVWKGHLSWRTFWTPDLMISGPPSNYW